VARALAQEVDLLLLDEPFAGVDVAAQADLMDILSSLNTDGLTILLSTHDLGLAFRRFNKVLALHQRVIAYGAPHDLHTSEVLRGLYGGGFTEVQENEQVTLYVDEHGCC
jgi:ABC-type Mn2+/Zn2+ transport system ATPase subunit